MQGGFIGGRRTAVASKQPCASQLVDHVPGIRSGQWMQSKCGVRQHVDEHATGSARDQRAEQRILDGADNHLHALRHHSLYEHGRHLAPKRVAKSA